MNLDVSFSEIGVIQVELEEAIPSAFEITTGFELPIFLELGTPGPQGLQGPPGDISTSSIDELLDVELSSPQEGDALVYISSKFRNYPINNIVDGGNF